MTTSNAYNQSTTTNAYVFIHNFENINSAGNNSNSTDNSVPAPAIYSFLTYFVFAIILVVCLNGSRKYVRLRNLGIPQVENFLNLRYLGMTRRTARSTGEVFLDGNAIQVRNQV